MTNKDYKNTKFIQFKQLIISKIINYFIFRNLQFSFLFKKNGKNNKKSVELLVILKLLFFQIK